MLARFLLTFCCFVLLLKASGADEEEQQPLPISDDLEVPSPSQTEPPPPPSEHEQPPTPPARVVGCSEQDQRSCDDMCKTDSFWYGYCASWDGRDLQCSCIAYKVPLDGNAVCGAERQEKCANECREKGQEAGGYCAVFPSGQDARGQSRCMCFDKPALN